MPRTLELKLKGQIKTITESKLNYNFYFCVMCLLYHESRINLQNNCTIRNWIPNTNPN